MRVKYSDYLLVADASFEPDKRTIGAIIQLPTYKEVFSQAFDVSATEVIKQLKKKTKE